MKKAFTILMYIVAIAMLVFVVSATTLGIEHKNITENLADIIVAFICALVAYANAKASTMFGYWISKPRREKKIVINLYK